MPRQEAVARNNFASNPRPRRCNYGSAYASSGTSRHVRRPAVLLLTPQMYFLTLASTLLSPGEGEDGQALGRPAGISGSED